MPLDHLVLPTGEQIGVPWRDSKAAHTTDVSRQRQLKRTAAQVPDLDGPVCRTARKPLVVRLDS